MRVGVQSLPIVAIVQIFIGVILALQLRRRLRPGASRLKVSRIIGLGGFRMLAPIITAVVLSGFAVASIAAECGHDGGLGGDRGSGGPRSQPGAVPGGASRAGDAGGHAAADGRGRPDDRPGGFATSRLVLGPESYVGYWERMQAHLRYRDFFTGLVQGGVFGVLISLIACYEGLKVKGGAEGVGKATTMTVVYSIVAVVMAACVFTIVFYVFNL